MQEESVCENEEFSLGAAHMGLEAGAGHFDRLHIGAAGTGSLHSLPEKRYSSAASPIGLQGGGGLLWQRIGKLSAN
jgi:hypothetical protein